MSLKKVMIVEDDMIIQMFLSKVVSGFGYEVISEARTCDQALSKLDLNKPDIILMDIGIAGNKDGIITSCLIHEKMDIPIIYITGNSDESTLKRAKESNPAGFVFKPIVENKLKKTLQEVSEQLDAS